MIRPRVVRELLEEWRLTPDGEAFGDTVVPVRTSSGRPAVLKVSAPRPESEHEALALQHWHGRGAVQLLRADPHRRALLLERLHREDLTGLWDREACEIAGGLYRSLHVPAPPQFGLLSSRAARWADQLEEAGRDAGVPPRMVEHARSLARDFAGDAATDGTLIHTDLHYANVLAGQREEWLAIDPEPLSGDPHFEVAPLLWHRVDEYEGRVRDAVRDRFFAAVDAAELDGRVRDGVRDRFLALVDGAGLEEDRARDWVIVRVMANVVGELASDHAADRSWVSAMLAVAKAVQ